jgi:AcrR family transcriptional regulator
MSTQDKPERGNQRTRILEAARALFADRGLDHVTMDDVAKEAGVARATVFNHFGAKHALVEGITEGVLAYYQGMLENALADRETPVPVLIRSLFEQMALGIEEDRRFYRSVFREIAKLRLGLDEGTAGQRAGRAALESLEHLMTRGQARAEITRQHRPEDLASVFDSLVNGTITHWLYDDTPESLQTRMQNVAYIFLRAATEGEGTTANAPRVSLAGPREQMPRGDQGASGARRKRKARSKS